ncbi:hypothetical protein L249_6500 [Ophiocordyceps polyrhachis-furcata BCC 54312]|uniref:Uncharacterized protein n=1 Tax=Ophiocordyceps polyrhachis-furcata BCC 54312 TaxID=1330021 RepID=A0A367LLP1_9HYPO|nr:hypothetical protein L249_6500 [Ophiocordyceps polyrhachis-furcata BCC 54312]
MDANVPSAVTQNRHMPRRTVAQSRRRSFNHAVRASAKRIAQAQDPDRPAAVSSAVDDSGSSSRAAMRPHVEAELRRQWSAARQTPRLRCRHRGASGDARDLDEAQEGCDLARSEVPLPSDRNRPMPRPTLEREDAFVESSTKIRLRPNGGGDNDFAVAELYQMGLLYDDKDATVEAESLNLNNIQHDQPIYSIRPDRRARRMPKPKAAGRDGALRLDLSFSDLGDDNTIAQYLAPPEVLAQDGEAAASPESGAARQQNHAPLRVIYELAGARPTFDVDTSQPPDLVTDITSDYDCFSDSELDDVPSERVVHDAGDWVMLGDDS